jgi:hypothetical protein
MNMDPELRRRLVALGELQRQWSARHESQTPYAPGENRPAGSDYNQHHVDVDASAAAEDDFHREARRVMGIDS